MLPTHPTLPLGPCVEGRAVFGFVVAALGFCVAPVVLTPRLRVARALPAFFRRLQGFPPPPQPAPLGRFGIVSHSPSHPHPQGRPGHSCIGHVTTPRDDGDAPPAGAQSEPPWRQTASSARQNIVSALGAVSGDAPCHVAPLALTGASLSGAQGGSFFCYLLSLQALSFSSPAASRPCSRTLNARTRRTTDHAISRGRTAPGACWHNGCPARNSARRASHRAADGARAHRGARPSHA